MLEHDPEKVHPFHPGQFSKPRVSKRDQCKFDRSRRARAGAPVSGLHQRDCTICVLAAAPRLE
jgi:hypothetical protein